MRRFTAALVLIVATIMGCDDDCDGSRDPELECEKTSDCACGHHFETGECFIGNHEHVVDTDDPCPDFCSGFSGDQEIKCVDCQCVQQAIE